MNLFEQGLSDFPSVKAFIDAGQPVPLGLKGTLDMGDHQILAIGYLAGDDDRNQIFCYDPNHPGEVVTLVPDFDRSVFDEVEHTDDTWLYYFADGTYAPSVPPAIPGADYPEDGLVHELLFQASTGNDDMRGAGDDVGIVVSMTDGTSYNLGTINGDQRWIANYTQTARFILPTPLIQQHIAGITLRDTFGGGIGGDNWDMNVLTVRGVGFGGFANDWVLAQAGTKRFTGDDQTLQVAILPPPPLPPPALSAIWPAGGPPEGGTSVTITGLNFDVGGTNQILFGGVPATSVSCSLPTQCTAIAPPGNGIESVSVIVDGTASPSWSAPLQYTYAPSVLSLSETAGSINDTITINGIGLGTATGNATAIHFGSYAATVFNCSPSECSVLVPPGAGTVDVTVTNGSTTTSVWPGDQFTYTPVSITKITPSTGGIAGGEGVTITGHGFDPLGKNMQVLFGTVPSTYIMCNGDTSCVVASPPGALGPVAITVQAFGETSANTAADVFTYMDEPPVLGMESVKGYVNGGVDYLVWLAGAAPPGGAIVNFWSSVPAIVVFPPSITIPAGQTEGIVHIVAGPSTTSGVAAFTATCGGAPYSGSLSYSPGPGTPALSFSLVFDLYFNSTESPVINLDEAAPAGGAVISLTSSDPSAIAVPATVVVPAGAYSTSFSITNLYDGPPETVTLTASYNGLIATSESTVSAAPPDAGTNPVCINHCLKGYTREPGTCVCIKNQ